MRVCEQLPFKVQLNCYTMHRVTRGTQTKQTGCLTMCADASKQRLHRPALRKSKHLTSFFLIQFMLLLHSCQEGGWQTLFIIPVSPVGSKSDMIYLLSKEFSKQPNSIWHILFSKPNMLSVHTLNVSILFASDTHIPIPCDRVRLVIWKSW